MHQCRSAVDSDTSIRLLDEPGDAAAAREVCGSAGLLCGALKLDVSRVASSSHCWQTLGMGAAPVLAVAGDFSCMSTLLHSKEHAPPLLMQSGVTT